MDMLKQTGFVADATAAVAGPLDVNDPATQYVCWRGMALLRGVHPGRRAG